MNEKYKIIFDELTSLGISKFLFKKPFKVVMHTFSTGDNDVIDIVGIYKGHGRFYAYGSGVTNLEYASDKLLDAIIENLDK